MASGIVPAKLSIDDLELVGAWRLTIRPARDHRSNGRRQPIDDVGGRSAPPGVEDQTCLCNSRAPAIVKSVVARVDGNKRIPHQRLDDAQGHGVASKSPKVLLVIAPADVLRGEALKAQASDPGQSATLTNVPVTVAP